MKKIRIHVHIIGRVQGVGYRYSTLQQAALLEVKGWVKNTFDGNVEAVFEGDEKAVENMLQWCYKGPAMAHVTNIQVFKEKYTGEFADFRIKR